MKTTFTLYRALCTALLVGVSSLVFGQIKLDVEGDVQIVGQLKLANTVADSSIYIGVGAGDVSTGAANVVVGTGAGSNLTTGTDNAVFGHKSLLSNTIGNYNTALGTYSLHKSSSASLNTAVGYAALYNATSQQGVVAVGGYALYNNGIGTTNATQGTNNVAVGQEALFSNTIGWSNTAVGHKTLFSNTTGAANVAIGIYAMYNNSNGYGNVAMGEETLFNNTSGFNNIAYGKRALYNNTTGITNTAVGVYTLYKNLAGYGNTAVGEGAMYNNTSGSENTAFGKFALDAATTGHSNTAIGVGSDVSSGDLIYAAAIGGYAVSNASHKMQLGSSTETLSTANGYTIVSDGRFKEDVKEDIKGLDFILSLRPVTYFFDYQQYDDFLRDPFHKATADRQLSAEEQALKEKTEKEYRQLLEEKSRERHIGFIAQEVEESAVKSGVTFNGLYKPHHTKDNYALDYGRFVVPMVKAIQEQQIVIKQQEARIKNQEEEIEELRITNGEIRNTNGALQQEVEDLHVRLAKLETLVQQQIAVPSEQAVKNQYSTSNNSAARLEQNQPNPFNAETMIYFYLPENVKSAQLVITDLQGRIVKTYSLQGNGFGSIRLDAGQLPAGTFFYTLVANDIPIDTKKMILTK